MLYNACQQYSLQQATRHFPDLGCRALLVYDLSKNIGTQFIADERPEKVVMTNGKQRPIYVTEEGLRTMQQELEQLRTVGREEVARRIGEAKADGDISENAAYDEAKNQQAFLEGRIMELEQRLKRSIVIKNHDTPADQVDIGRLVTIRETGFDEPEVYFIVGSAEASPSNGRISNESPMGKALIGKKVGACISVQTPGGMLEFEVIAIE